MTAFVFDIAPDRLAIGADTATYAIGAQNRLTGFVSKVWTIPRLRFALAGRGIVDIGLRAYCELAIAPVSSFDDAVELLPALLREATEEWADKAGVDDHEQRQVFEAIFGGFDRQAGRARLFSAYNYDGYEVQEMPAGAGGCGVIPSLPARFRPDVTGIPLNRQVMVGLKSARAYFAANPEQSKGAVVGGDVELTTITAAGITTECIGHLPVPIATGEPLEAADVREALTPVSELLSPETPRQRPSRAAAKQGSAAGQPLLFGIGAGLGAGMLLNSLVGGNTLTGGIGSGLGSLAGAAIGSIIPGIGTLIGALIGGAGGGLFGGPLGRDKSTVNSSRIVLA